jgi:hypothetical protein
MAPPIKKHSPLFLVISAFFDFHYELLEQLLAPKKSETEILVVRPAPASSTAPTARA